MSIKNIKSRFYQGASLFILLLGACGDPGSSELSYTEIPANISSQRATLGMGWNADSEIFVGRCIEGEVETAGSNESSVAFDNSMSQDELMKALGFSFSAKSRFGVFSGRASAQFAATSKEDRFSNVTVYRAQYDFENIMFFPNGEMTPVGRRLKNDSAPKDAWEKGCGHEYVSQITKGAKLIISARIDFLSEEDKRDFNGRFRITGSAWSAKAELAMAAEEFRNRASVSISAYQQGGDVSQLSKAFSRVDEADGSSFLIRCSMIDIDACVQTLSQLIQYATERDDSKNYFPAQIADNGGNGGGADLKYLTSDYLTAGIFPDHDSMYRWLLEEERRAIEEKLERNVMFRNRLRAFNSMSNIDQLDGVPDLIEKLREKIPSNQRLIADAIRMCFDRLRLPNTSESGQSDCQSAKDRLDAEFWDVEDHALNIERIACGQGRGYFGGPEWQEVLLDEEGRRAGTGIFSCNVSGESEVVDVLCEKTHKRSAGEALTCEPKYCNIPNSNRKLFYNDSTTMNVSNGRKTYSCNYPDTMGPKISCNNGYLERDGECLRQCVGDYVAGDSWSVDIDHGTRKDTCRADGSVSSSISCNRGFTLNRDECRPDTSADPNCGRGRPTWTVPSCDRGGELIEYYRCESGIPQLVRTESTGRHCL